MRKDTRLSPLFCTASDGKLGGAWERGKQTAVQCYLGCAVNTGSELLASFLAPQISSCVEFRDALCTCKLGAAKYGEQVSSANQLQQTLILDFLDSRLFRIHTSENCFHQPLRCSLCLQVHFQVANFLRNGQNVMCTHGFILQSDWYWHSGGSRQLFPRMLPGSLLPRF